MESKQNIEKNGEETSSATHPGGKQRLRRLRPDDNPTRRAALVNVGKRIAQLRTKKNWTQEGFADACGLYRSHIGAIERGEANITLSTLEIIVDKLNITISRLFKGIA